MSSHVFSKLPLHGLRVFEASARLGSFKDAASELSVTPAAVSHQIKALEAFLGLALFERRHRGLSLTPAGEKLGSVARAAFHDIEEGLSELLELHTFAGSTVLSLSAAPSFAGKWLAPRLHRFQALHPRLELRLQAEDTLVDLVRDRSVDVAVRYGAEPRDSRLEASMLWPPGKIVAVCAPSLAQDGSLGGPEDLLRYQLLRTGPPRSSGRDYAARARSSGWSAWLAAAGVSAQPPLRGLMFGNTQMTLDAAAAGRGIALAPSLLVEDDLRTGLLIQPFDIAIPDPFCFWLLFRSDRAAEARIRSFAAWIRAETDRENA